MPKAKKTHKGETSDESQSEDSDKPKNNSVSGSRKQKKLKKKASKHANRKNRSTKDSEEDDSSSSGTTSSSSDSSASEDETRKVPQHDEHRSYKQSEHKSHSDERGKRHRKHSRERDNSSSGGEAKVSKWDSPERRSRQTSRSRSRQRHEHNKEYRKSEERDIERKRERVNRSRNEYPDRNNWHDRRDNRARYVDNRNRGGERWRDTRDRGNERYNERIERSHSPHAYSGQSNNARFKREPRDHNRSPNRRPNRFPRRGSRGDDRKNYEWGGKGGGDKQDEPEVKAEAIEKEKPNFGLSGALLEDTNKVNGVIIKYSEPPEARKPKRRWRLYPFKGETALPTLHIHRQSCFLVGRDRKVADLAVDHPSCSKQHAALQYRLVSFDREDGTQGKRVRLYLIDLESANGTFLNNKKIDPRKYYELIEKDVIKFGFSTREYVLLHENSKEDQEDDDVIVKPEPEDIPDGPNP